MVFIYIHIPEPGFVRDGSTNRGGRHQVFGGSEWMGRCGGGGIKDACLVAVGLLCIVRLSCFSSSVCRRGFQAVLRIRPTSLFILFGCISISIASLRWRFVDPVLAERSLVSCNRIFIRLQDTKLQSRRSWPLSRLCRLEIFHLISSSI
jgi:hypothetical protein